MVLAGGATPMVVMAINDSAKEAEENSTAQTFQTDTLVHAPV